MLGGIFSGTKRFQAFYADRFVFRFCSMLLYFSICYIIKYILGNIQSGLPPFALPPFSRNRTEGNTTVVMGFGDICLDLGASIGLIPLIAILEQVAIAKAFGTKIYTIVFGFYISYRLIHS